MGRSHRVHQVMNLCHVWVNAYTGVSFRAQLYLHPRAKQGNKSMVGHTHHDHHYEPRHTTMHIHAPPTTTSHSQPTTTNPTPQGHSRSTSKHRNTTENHNHHHQTLLTKSKTFQPRAEFPSWMALPTALTGQVTSKSCIWCTRSIEMARSPNPPCPHSSPRQTRSALKRGTTSHTCLEHNTPRLATPYVTRNTWPPNTTAKTSVPCELVWYSCLCRNTCHTGLSGLVLVYQHSKATKGRKQKNNRTVSNLTQSAGGRAENTRRHTETHQSAPQ